MFVKHKKTTKIVDCLVLQNVEYTVVHLLCDCQFLVLVWHRLLIVSVKHPVMSCIC